MASNEREEGAPGVAQMGDSDKTGVTGGTNFVLFDFRALTAFDERKPHVVTLSDTGTARLLLVMFRPGQSLPPQRLASEVSIQALRGRLRLSVGSSGASTEPAELAQSAASATELRAGRLAQVEAETPYRLDAISEAVALLYLTPSPGVEALGPDLRGPSGPLVTRA